MTTAAGPADRLPQADYQRQPTDPAWLASVVQFHGHLGPAVVAGARISMIGLRAVEAKGCFDVEVTCEGPLAKPPQACFLDGVQVAMGATMGKRTLHWTENAEPGCEVRKKNGRCVMNDQDKSREQLIAELEELRQRLAEERSTPEMKTAAALFRVAPLGIHECDTKGRIIFVNPSQEAITGYTADELIGTCSWDRLPPGPEKDSLPAYFKHLISEQPAPVPFFAKNIRKSGEVFDARIDWNYIRNPEGEVTGFVSVVSDSTEHKRAEEELARNKAILQAAIESLPFEFFAVGSDGRYILQNAILREHYGEAIGNRPEDYAPDEYRRQLWLDNNRRAFAGERVEGEVEARVGDNGSSPQ